MLGFIARLFRAPKPNSHRTPIYGPFGPLTGVKLLRSLMFAKDEELALEFFTGSVSAAFRKWKAKYPEDFTGLDGSSPAYELGKDPRRHIILHSKASA